MDNFNQIPQQPNPNPAPPQPSQPMMQPPQQPHPDMSQSQQPQPQSQFQQAYQPQQFPQQPAMPTNPQQQGAATPLSNNKTMAMLPKIILAAAAIIFVIGLIQVITNAPSGGSSSYDSSSAPASSGSTSANSTPSPSGNTSTNSNSASSSSGSTSSESYGGSSSSVTPSDSSTTSATTFTVQDLSQLLVDDDVSWYASYAGKTITVTNAPALKDPVSGEVYEFGTFAIAIKCSNIASLNLISGEKYAVTGTVTSGNWGSVSMSNCVTTAE